MALLTINNAKTRKGEKFGYMTGIIYMIPNKKTCAFSEVAGCLHPCINETGRGMYSTVKIGRQRRTDYFMNDKKNFMEQLFAEIKLLEIKARKEGKIPVVRLNGTSDIQYEDIPVLGYDNIFNAFPQIQFYDYTKIVNRLYKKLPSNYDLTFSYSGTAEFLPYVQRAVNNKARMSVVFHGKKLPTEFMGMEVIDGDEHDLRFQESKNVIVGLKFKKVTTKKFDPNTSDFIVKC